MKILRTTKSPVLLVLIKNCIFQKLIIPTPNVYHLISPVLAI